MKTRMSAGLALCAALALAGAAWATGPGSAVISVPEMHCAGCGKKVAASVAEVPGVERAEPDVATKSIKVTVKPQPPVSVKALWEAVEKAGQKPASITTPGGTYTAKPQS